MMKFKRKIFWLIIIFAVQLLFAQSQIQLLNKPEPSISSLSTYSAVPISHATGIPEISYPIASIASNRLSFDFSLNYHPHNALSNERASDIGLGWSLLGQNVISREIVGQLDETYWDATAPNYVRNEFNDNYYITLNNKTLKFRVKRNLQQNTFEIEKLSPSNWKIDYVREDNSATLIFKSFTITDDAGFVYLFNVHSTAQYGMRAIKSAFYVSKIFDARTNEVANYDYRVDTYTSPTTVAILNTHKISKVNVIDYGSIEFTYNLDPAMRSPESLNDPYSLQTIILKDLAGKLISSHQFQYTLMSFSNPFSTGQVTGKKNKRLLHSITRISKDGSSQETTQYEYNSTGSILEYSPVPGQFMDHFIYSSSCPSAVINELQNPKYFPYGTLSKIKLPTGGRIEYTFESNQYHTDKGTEMNYGAAPDFFFTDPEVENLRKTQTISFNSNISTHYGFNIDVNPDPYSTASVFNKVVYIKFVVNELYPYPPGMEPLPGTEPKINFHIPSIDYYQTQYEVLCSNSTETIVRFRPMNGQHMVTVLGLPGGNGYFEVYELEAVAPYNNVVSKFGVRLHSIKMFNGSVDSIPQKTKTFSYQKFESPLQSSGELFNSGFANGYTFGHILYKNVKEIDENGGYTKYYFKTPLDYPTQETGLQTPYDKYLPYVDVTKGGLLEKKVIYSVNNEPVEMQEFSYVIEEVGNSPYFLTPFTVARTYMTKPAFIKNRSVANSFIDGANVLTATTEIELSSSNYQTSLSKVLSADGILSEVSYTYPQAGSNQELVNRNILNVPLITETKRAGTLISKQETKYENTSHFFPTSQVSYLPDNPSQGVKNISYDIYDDKGNLVQFTEFPDVGTGKSTTIIWGYNKTMPLAKVEGAKLSDIPAALISSIVLASNADANASSAQEAATELALVEALNLFRSNTAMKDFMISCYTYDPLVGVTKMIPPTGLMETYQYDTYNRLHRVLDVNGVTLKEYQYNYKQ